MNRWTGTGRLTRDPEIRYTQSQTAISSFGIAVDKWKGDADFFNCVAFGKTAEHIDKYWKKGMKALISGRIETDAWTGKDGTKKTGFRIIVEEIEFCEKKGEGNQVETITEKWAPVPEGDDEELPFKF